MSVMFFGTSSGAGKTTVAAMCCRHLCKTGADAAPFKALNLSSLSVGTSDGGRIGSGQYFQAVAAGTEPNKHMNPILLVPRKTGGIDTMLFGKTCNLGRKELLDRACESYDLLAGEHEIMVCEGSGSPVEINIMDSDIANVGMLRKRPMPVILVGDIERGGVFAAIYGTWRLMPEELKPLLSGFVINRFRGDVSILKEATDRIESLTGMACLGVLPYVDLSFQEEDSLSEKSKASGWDEFLDNLDELLCKAAESGFDFDKMDEIIRRKPL